MVEDNRGSMLFVKGVLYRGVVCNSSMSGASVTIASLIVLMARFIKSSGSFHSISTL